MFVLLCSDLHPERIIHGKEKRCKLGVAGERVGVIGERRGVNATLLWHSTRESGRGK